MKSSSLIKKLKSTIRENANLYVGTSNLSIMMIEVVAQRGSNSQSVFANLFQRSSLQKDNYNTSLPMNQDTIFTFLETKLQKSLIPSAETTSKTPALNVTFIATILKKIKKRIMLRVLPFGLVNQIINIAKRNTAQPKVNESCKKNNTSIPSINISTIKHPHQDVFLFL